MEKHMQVRLNPEYNKTRIRFGNENSDLNENDIALQVTKNPLEYQNEIQERPQISPEQKNKPKGLLSKIAYGWVNFVEATKGLAKGLFYGLLSGTVVAGANWIYSGIKKYRRGNKNGVKIKLSELLNRNKTMTRTGKIASYITAGVVFVAHIILAKLKANKRTANVDHMLYDGHRS